MSSDMISFSRRSVVATESLLAYARIMFLEQMKNLISIIEKLNDMRLLVRFIRDTATGNI
jgi:hypothetical protein